MKNVGLLILVYDYIVVLFEFGITVFGILSVNWFWNWYLYHLLRKFKVVY